MPLTRRASTGTYTSKANHKNRRISVRGNEADKPLNDSQPKQILKVTKNKSREHLAKFIVASIKRLLKSEVKFKLNGSFIAM